MTPGLPGTTAPPAGTLLPSGGTPGAQGALTPPSGAVPPQQIARSVETSELARATSTVPGCPDPERETKPARDPSSPRTDDSQRDASRRTDCPDARQPQRIAAEKTERTFGSEAPLTPGREFAYEPLWNVWVDATYTDTTDRRNGVDLDGRGTSVTLGADRSLTTNLVAGVSLSVSTNHTTEFRDISRVDSTGLTVSPYVGYRILPSWTLNATIGFGWTDNTHEIAVLSTNYVSVQYSGSLTASGDYTVGGITLRPKLSVSYSRTVSRAHDITGTIRGVPISHHVEEATSDFGVADFTLEVNRSFTLSNGMAIIPYLEVGGTYEFKRPNDGKILTSDLTFAPVSPWAGTVRAGARVLLTGSLFVEVSGGYLSIGHSDLNIWEAGLFLSYGF